MKTNLLFVALICALLSFNACKQSDTDEPEVIDPVVETPLTAFPHIKTEIQDFGNNSISTITYEYDDQARLTKQTYGGYYIKYTHKADRVLRDFYYTDGTLSSTMTFMTDQAGRTTSEFIGLFNPGKFNTFHYDQSGYLVAKKSGNDTIYSAVITEGNKVSKKEYAPGVRFDYNIIDFQYITKPNTIGDENRGITWMGKQDKYLPSGIKKQHVVGDIVTESTEQYTYEFDSKNRVSKMTVSYGNQSYSISYTYY